jgi:DUF1365 family protein
VIQHSKIFRGEVTHRRVSPTQHAFTYPVTFFAFDLSELPDISRQVSYFGHNSKQLLTLNDHDYLYGQETSIIEQLEALLGPQEAGQRTLLITSPRYCGYAFNPVNFHLRIEGDQLLSVVAEVNNTFGDRHVYPLKDLQKQKNENTWVSSCPKEFHVSPFNDVSGEYRFTFRIAAEELFLEVDLYRDNECILQTWIQGNGRPLTHANIRKFALLHPFDSALNSMPRIIWQAALLYYKKKLKAYQRPSPQSKHTLVDRDQKKEASRTII